MAGLMVQFLKCGCPRNENFERPFLMASYCAVGRKGHILRRIYDFHSFRFCSTDQCHDLSVVRELKNWQ